MCFRDWRILAQPFQKNSYSESLHWHLQWGIQEFEMGVVFYRPIAYGGGLQSRLSIC